MRLLISGLSAGNRRQALTSRATPRRVRLILWAAANGFALAVGCSRVWLGVHWPSDVAGAFLYGIAWSAACLSVVSRA